MAREYSLFFCIKPRTMQTLKGITLQITVFCLALSSAAAAEIKGPVMGPVIEQYGPVVEVPDAYELLKGVPYGVVLDVASSPENQSELNRGIESAARFLNMSVRAGADVSDLQVAVVLHGDAAKDALDNESYRSRYQTDNPNDGLLSALKEAGVAIYLCGQSAGFRGIQPGELHPAITMATSAMTVHTRLQAEGWSVIP